MGCLRLSKKSTLDEGSFKADARGCGGFRGLPRLRDTQSPAIRRTGAFLECEVGREIKVDPFFVSTHFTVPQQTGRSADQTYENEPSADAERCNQDDLALHQCVGLL
jgi:hypothetical protein